MLIAVSLTTVLMTAVWGLMSTYATLQTAGADVAAEQQLVRSVLQLVRDDLQMVSLPAAENVQEYHDSFTAFDDVVADAVTATDRINHDTFSIVFDINNLTRNAYDGPSNVSIRGDSEVLRITVPYDGCSTTSVDDFDQLSGDLPAIDSVLPNDVTPSVNEFQTIIYQVQPFGSARHSDLPPGLYRIQTNAARLQAMRDRRSRSDRDIVQDDLRLNRSNLEELLFPPADHSGSGRNSRVKQPTCDLIPEVVGCQFEYSHGGGWRRDWTSEEAGQLPRAVRITLEVVLLRELDELQAVNVTGVPAGRLERRLNLSFVRPQTHTRMSRATNRPFTSRSYSELILMDSTIATAVDVRDHSKVEGSVQ
ncbi:MAG: type II secretion system protein GspJ [Fuerstiella sp.]|nr:type II secretion system protein GspJ [Fuerstiella sp.]